MRIHEFNISCYDKKEYDLTGNTVNLWLKASFDLDCIVAAKQNVSDEDEHMLINETTIYLNSGDSFVIDMDYDSFKVIWMPIEQLKLI